MNNIILTGYMGSGKSSVSRLLGSKLDIRLIDTDEKIERDADMKISRIFEEYGEERFREMETELLRSLKNESGTILISTGGGMPLRPENRKLLKELGTVIYLKASPKVIARRLEHDTTRPLLAGTVLLSEKEERIGAMLKNREAAYLECADMVIDTDDMSVEDIVSRICSEIHV